MVAEGQIPAAGSPAYAGIDLVHRPEIMAPCGFPRLRGDRPPYADSDRGGTEVPPPTRG